MKRTIILEIITLLMLSLFFYAAISKIMDNTLFKEQLAGSPILKPVAGMIAWLLPAIELAVVILLIVPHWRLKGLYTSFGLLVIFTIYILAMMATSDRLPCSCGGLLELLSWKAHIVFNSAFMGLAFEGVMLERKRK